MRDDRLYICGVSDFCDDDRCGGRRPGVLFKVWGIDTAENYKGFPCSGAGGRLVHPVLYNGVPQEEIDKLFTWE